jgi:hypothetical protein
VRLGYTRRGLARRLPVSPARRTANSYRYCTKRNSGSVTAVFSKRSRSSRVELVLSGAPSKAFHRAYPTRRRIARGLFRASPRSRRLLGVRGDRIRFIAVAGERALRNRARLLRDLKLARG